MRVKTPLANAAAPQGLTQGHNAGNSQTYGLAAQKSFVTRGVDEPCRACVSSVSAPRRAGDGRPPISCIRYDVADAKKFHDLRKISSTPELKYFRLRSLLSLRRDIAGRREIHNRDHERSKSMHIAQIAPLTEAIPPKLYGGTERVVSWLTEELIALGHEVTLFASAIRRPRPSSRRCGRGRCGSTARCAIPTRCT